MAEPEKGDRIARVIDVRCDLAGTWHSSLMIGEVTHRASGCGTPPRLGDAFEIRAVDPLELGARIATSLPDAWSERSDALRWRTPNRRGQTRRAALRLRHLIRRAVRDYLDGEGFIEIDTPLLVRGTTPDAVIQSFRVDDRYLIASSEYQIKRLAVGGFDTVYTLTQNFRAADGDGPYRNQEFTMLEWARAGGSLMEIEADAERMVRQAHERIGGRGTLSFKGHVVDMSGQWDRTTVADAVERFIGVSLPGFNLEDVCRAVEAAGIDVQPSWREDVHFLFAILMDHIQPRLGISKPVFLHDWPAFETSSAHEKAGQTVADRSELFIAGVEIADGFPSMTSFDRQLRTFEEQRERRRLEGLPDVEIDQAYLDAMRVGLPRGAGMALGFDRLVMVLTGREQIRDVLAFAWDEL